MHVRWLGLLFLGVAAAANAEVVTRPIEYTVGDKTFRSVLVYDSAGAKRPGLVLVPNWMGANDSAVEKAKAIAGKDYVILVADVYGKDIRPKDTKEAGAAAHAAYGDLPALRARAAKGLEVLQAQAASAPLDGKHWGAIGFCFGGATALELARSGADIAGVVSFHGNLSTNMPVATAGTVKASIVAINGANDSYVPADQIAAFQKEFTDAKADWQFVNMSGAVHCFAEPDANSPPGCVYNPLVADRSYKLMRSFFAERFAAK
jgi:dienelactone hydrolase